MRGMGSWIGRWLRVVRFLCVCLGSRVSMSPICGRSSMRALWSPYYGVRVAMCVFMFVWCVCVCVLCFTSQWSIAVFAGICVCMSCVVICLSSDYFKNWLRGSWYDLLSPAVGVAWRSQPMMVFTVGSWT